MTVHLDPYLLLAGPSLKISLGGFWKLRWLNVQGAAAMPGGSCAIVK